MIDASLYSQIQGPKQTNMLEQFARMQQIQGAQSQNRLADLMYGEKERDIGADKAMAGFLSRGEDVAKGLASQGYGKQSIAYTKDQQGAAKQRGEIDKQRVDLVDAKLKQSRAFLENITTPEQYIEWHEGNHKDPVLGPVLAARGVTAEKARASIMEAFQRPGGFEELLKKSALGIEKFTEFNKPTTSVLNNGAENQVIQTPGLGGTPQIVMTAPITQSANGKATDDRAREFNATKVEENKLKREAKDDTANLTKASQLASFDTMLGTLSRLGNHPGLSRSVGAMGIFPTMPGSDSANFQAELNTFQSQAFIPMVAQLKGMGALSDAEGKKLTAAVGALDPKMGEPAFRESVKRITDDMTAARDRMVGGGNAKSDGRTGSWGDPQAPSAPVNIKNAADYANIPSGATYIDPNGKMRTKK